MLRDKYDKDRKDPYTEKDKILLRFSRDLNGEIDWAHVSENSMFLRCSFSPN